MSFPPKSWSGRWYAAILQNPKMLEAFLFSVKLAAGVTVVNLAIAVPASYALVRLAPRGAEAMTSLFTAPLSLPTIVLGLAMPIIFARIGLLATVPAVVAHLVVTLPYVCCASFRPPSRPCRSPSRKPPPRSARRPRRCSGG